LKRGDVVLAATPGDYGEPRPAIVTQSDLFNETHPSVVVCPLTSFCIDAPLLRVSVEPSEGNGLRQPSQVMVDKITTLRRERLRRTIGRLDRDTMTQVDRALMVFLGLC